MIDDNSTDYKIKDLIERLKNDEAWQADEKLRLKAAALMKRYSTSV